MFVATRVGQNKPTQAGLATMSKLQGKIALITGGNSGIGFATAQLFAQEGASVIITGRDDATLTSAAARIGGQVRAIRADVSVTEDLNRLFDTIKSDYGRLDIVFANAGIFKASPLAQETEEQYHEIFDINVKGVFFTIQRAEAIISDGGSIIINASTVIHSGMSGGSLYSASKAAVRQLARNLSNELAPRNVRVNVVSPGYTRTPIVGRAGFDSDQVEGFYAFASGEIPLRRPGNPEEIAKAVLFLASDDSSYITGDEIKVDGGHAAVGAAGVVRG